MFGDKPVLTLLLLLKRRETNDSLLSPLLSPLFPSNLVDKCPAVFLIEVFLAYGVYYYTRHRHMHRHSHCPQVWSTYVRRYVSIYE